jgi:hypothetical protein
VTIMRKPGKQRIMVQLWGTIAKAIDRDFKSLHIKRDPYLNDLLGREIENLDSEVKCRNSDAARDLIQTRKLPERVKLTIELDETLVKRIDDVLKERNIPRDSFVNRILFFLIAKKQHLDALGVSYSIKSEATAKPLHDASGFLADPFFHIRSCNDERFYTLACFPDGPFGDNGPNLFALNTAISDEDWAFMKFVDDLSAEFSMLSDTGVSHVAD